jgi:hypothetical protein
MASAVIVKNLISALHFIHDIDNHYQNISYCCYLFLLRNDPQKWGIMIEGCLHEIFPFIRRDGSGLHLAALCAGSDKS